MESINTVTRMRGVMHAAVPILGNLAKRGIMEEFKSGAKRSEKKLPYNLLPTVGLAAIADRFRIGAEKYTPHNWKKAIGSEDKEFVQQLWDHAFAHMLKIKDLASQGSGFVDEEGEGILDHIGAVGWGVVAMAEYFSKDPALFCAALSQELSK